VGVFLKHYKPKQSHCTQVHIERSYKLIIQKITKSSYPNMRNAYKNKCTTSRSQLSLTETLTQNKARKATNTSRATLELELCIYIENYA
jgi:hypothetical protein